MSDEQVYFHTLRWVNGQRARFGLPPLDHLRLGARGSTRACPVAESLDRRVQVTGDCLMDIDEDVWVALPVVVREFVRRFDAGGLSELHTHSDISRPVDPLARRELVEV